MKKKQFRKKDYKPNLNLCGLCIDYNMSLICRDDGSRPDSNEEYELAYNEFRKRSQLLNIGEYFSMNIFGHKVFAYRNEEGIFTR